MNELKTAKELNIPLELLKDKDTVVMVIQYLSIHKKIIEGKTVPSSDGIRNKIKHYLLGYPLIQRTFLCKKCGTPMVLEKTDDKGTVIHLLGHQIVVPNNPLELNGYQIQRDVTMSFNWLYFTCPKCGWGRVTTDDQ